VRVLFVTNVVTHYRAPLYQKLAERLDVRFLLYSDGREWYWNGGSLPLGDLPGKVLSGWWIGRTRIVPELLADLWRTDYDVVVKCINGRFALPVTYAAARARGKPFILWTSLWRHPTSGFHRLTGPAVRLLYRNADAIVTYGRHVSRYVASQGASPDRVFEAPQAIDLDRFSGSPSDTSGQVLPEGAREQPIVLYVGRLESWKGPHILLRALAEAAKDRPFTAVFAGDGSMRGDLERDAGRLGLTERTLFLGHVPSKDLPGLYRTAATVIVPSIETPDFSEPWSLVVNEALASCKPVIASDAVGAVRDGLLAHGRTGLVVPSGEALALAQAIRIVLDGPRKANELALAGHRVVADYSYDAAVEAFCHALDVAVDGRLNALENGGASKTRTREQG